MTDSKTEEKVADTKAPEVDILALLKQAMLDPEIKAALKTMVQDEDIETKLKKPRNKKVKVVQPTGIEVFEVDEKDIPEIERNANKQIKSDPTYIQNARPEQLMIDKMCGCGRKFVVVAGGPLDQYPFICNKCLVG